MWFYVNKIIDYRAAAALYYISMIKLILEAYKAKIDWLRARLVVNKILLKVISGKTATVMISDDHMLFNSGT